MELKHIKELMSVMSRTGTKRLKLREGDFELILERPEYQFVSGNELAPVDLIEDRFHANIQARTDQALSRGGESGSRMASSVHPEKPKEDKAGVYITSPMVGTFYASPAPVDPHFVKVGDKVEKNTVVCIIEAMKVMNEIKANVTGTVAEVLIESGQPVEFGAKLFRIVE